MLLTSHFRDSIHGGGTLYGPFLIHFCRTSTFSLVWFPCLSPLCLEVRKVKRFRLVLRYLSDAVLPNRLGRLSPALCCVGCYFPPFYEEKGYAWYWVILIEILVRAKSEDEHVLCSDIIWSVHSPALKWKMMLDTVALGEPNLVDALLAEPLRVKNCCFPVLPSPSQSSKSTFCRVVFQCSAEPDACWPDSRVVQNCEFCVIYLTLSRLNLSHLYRCTWHNICVWMM